jgi:hypothetical protein
LLANSGFGLRRYRTRVGKGEDLVGVLVKLVGDFTRGRSDGPTGTAAKHAGEVRRSRSRRAALPVSPMREICSSGDPAFRLSLVQAASSLAVADAAFRSAP